MAGMVTGGFEMVAEGDGDEDEDGDGDGDGAQGEGEEEIVDGDDAPMEISDEEQARPPAPVAAGGGAGAAEKSKKKKKKKKTKTQSEPSTDSSIPSTVSHGVEKLEIVEGKEFVEADKKRLDVITMIRQAKAKAAADKAKQDSVAANADFISLSFDDGKPKSHGGNDADDLAQDRRKMRRLNDSSKTAPDRPNDRPFSHKEAIHGVYVPKQPIDDGPPGVGPLSRAAKLPPPPGLDARRPKWKGKGHHRDSPSDSCSDDDDYDDDGDDDDDDEYDPELLPISTDQVQAHRLDVPLARKRKYDEISRSDITGNIKYEFRPKPGVNHIPWNTNARDHSRTLHMSVW